MVACPASVSRVRLQRGRTVSNRRLTRVVGAVLSTLALLLQGCYETLPLQQGPAPATVTVQLVMNDKGRLAVADKLGGSVDKVEGVVTAQNADSYTISITDVYQLNGNVNKWEHEAVTIAKEGVDGYKIHRFNQARTLVLAAAVTVAVVVFVVTAGIKATGSAASSGPGGPGGTTSPSH